MLSHTQSQERFTRNRKRERDFGEINLISLNVKLNYKDTN